MRTRHKTLSIFMMIIMLLSTVATVAFAEEELPENKTIDQVVEDAELQEETSDQTDEELQTDSQAETSGQTSEELQADPQEETANQTNAEEQSAELQATGKVSIVNIKTNSSNKNYFNLTIEWEQGGATEVVETNGEEPDTTTRSFYKYRVRIKDGTNVKYDNDDVEIEVTEGSASYRTVIYGSSKNGLSKSGKYTAEVVPYVEVEDPETHVKSLEPDENQAQTLSGIAYPTIAKVKNLKAYPGYKSVTLKWTKVSGATYYVIERKHGDGSWKKVCTKKATSAKTQTYRNKVTVPKDKTTIRSYKYRVKARKKSYGEYIYSSSYSNQVSSNAVRSIYQDITFSETVRLTSHDGKNKSITFKNGQKVRAEGFGQGKYKFYYKGYWFYVSYLRVHNCKAIYKKTRNDNYSKTTAENFVNERANSSKTKYLIWVSTYTQHMYIFKGKKGKWKLYKHWEVSTGKAASPSPTGFGKSIQTKIRSRSGISWWNTFQSYNSIHGKRSSYEIDGAPHSHGCVRNYNSKAEWIYKNLPVGTGLIIF